MIEIEAPDGTIIEFPEGTDDATILRVMQAEYGGGQGAQAPERGIGQRLYDNIIGDPNDGVDSWGERAGRTLNEVGRSAGAGVARGAAGLLDFPGALISGAGDLAFGGMERAGLISPEVAEGGRQSMAMATPFGGGQRAQEGMEWLTGGGSEYRSPTTAGQFAGTVGEFLPGAALFGGGSAGNLLRYAVAPGVASEAAGQATEGTSAEPWARMAAALAAPVAAGGAERVARRVVSPFGGADPQRLALAQTLDDSGVPVTAGQRVGSNRLRRFEGASSAGQGRIAEQQEAFTRAALRTTGTDASRATPDVLAAADARIGQVFRDAVRGVDVVPDPAMMNGLANSVQTYSQLAPTSAQAPVFGNMLREVARTARGGNTIPGSTLNVWRSRLSKLTTSPDAATRSAAIEALDIVDDALTRSLTAAGRPQDVSRLTEAREQWRNLLAIQRAASGAGEGAAAGVISPSALRNAVATQGRTAYAQGRRGDIGALARAGEGVMKPLPTSGTMENLRAVGVPVAASAGAGAALGGPYGAIIGALAPGLAREAATTGPVQAWLGNQLVGRGSNIADGRSLGALINALAQGSGGEGSSLSGIIEALMR